MRILIVNFAGGLAANLFTVLLVGAAIAYVHLSKRWVSSLTLMIEVLVIFFFGAIVAGWGIVRIRRSPADREFWWAVSFFGGTFLLEGRCS